MPTATYDLIASTTLPASTSVVQFSGLPQNYRDLVLVISQSGGSNTDEQLRFNGDTGSNYSFVRMFGDGSSPGTSSVSSTYIRNIGGDLAALHNITIQIMDYSATNKHKTTLGRGNNASTLTMATAGRWANTAAITSLTYFVSLGSFAAGSTYSLYGIAS